MKHLLILALVLTTAFSWGQKKELKTAQKLYNKSDIAGAKDILATNKSLFEGAEIKIASEYNLLQSQIALNEKDYKASLDYLNLAMKNSGIQAKTAEQKRLLTKNALDTAIEQSSAEDYIASAKNLHLVYSIDPENNTDYLYYAASNAVNQKESYNLALEYYAILKDIKYEGIVTKYFATEVASGEEQEVTVSEYDLFQKTKDYTDFRTSESDSKFPEIVKNIALIYNSLGEREKAMEAIKDARAADPKDLGLILTEANIYIELGENERFKELMIEAIAQSPDDPDLYLNLGIVTKQLGDLEDARKYYEKAIELNPEFEKAYLGLVYLILEGETAIVDKMNSLGNSKADNIKYDKLKGEKDSLYTECVPILEKLISFSEENKEAIELLKNIYGTLGNNEGFMKLKKKLEELGE